MGTTAYYKDAFYECISIMKHASDDLNNDALSYVTINTADGKSVSVIMKPIDGGWISPKANTSAHYHQYYVQHFMVDKTHPADWFVRGIGFASGIGLYPYFVDR
jgi:hypothetical protein